MKPLAAVVVGLACLVWGRSAAEAEERIGLGRLLPSIVNAIEPSPYISQRAVGNLARAMRREPVSAHLEMAGVFAGQRPTVDFTGDGLVRFAVESAIPGHPVALNGQQAGSKRRAQTYHEQVVLPTSVVNDVLINAVNTTGIVAARSVVSGSGVVRLVGDQGPHRLAMDGEPHSRESRLAEEWLLVGQQRRPQPVCFPARRLEAISYAWEP